MKKLLWLFGALFVALFVALISVPLFVNVDQYRPLISDEANRRMNGKLELGKLSLSLWGAVKIHAESIRLSVNGISEPMLDTKQFHLEIPFSSLLMMRPQVIAVLDSPKISLVKDQNGMNALRLLKTAARDEAAPAQDIQGTMENKIEDSVRAVSAAPAEPIKVPALLVGATLGLRINNGDVHFQDRLTKSDYQVDGLDLEAKNLGLGSEMQMHLVAPLKGASPQMKFSGPIEANAEFRPVLQGANLRGASGFIELDASKLGLEFKGGLFSKKEGMPLVFKAQFEGDEKETLVKNADLQLHDVKLHGKGRITLQPLTAKFDINTDTVRLDKIADFVPMMGAYNLRGALDFSVKVDQDIAGLKLNGDLKLSDGSIHPKQYLKEPLKMQLQLGFSENSLSIARAGLSAPESDLQIQGSVRNFLSPQFNISANGKSLNLDKLLVLEAKKTAGISILPNAVAAEGAKEFLNPLLPLAANPIFAKASGSLVAQVAKLTIFEAELMNFSVKSQLQSLQLKLQEASFRSFGGNVKASGDFDLRSPSLAYKTQGSVNGISAKEAFSKYFPKFQNTLEGTVNGTWNVSGSAYPESARLKSMRGSAKLSAADGALKSVDFQSSINSVMQKVPFLKDKKPIAIDNGFKSLVADLRFDNGTIRVEPIESQPRNQGFVIKGKSTIQDGLDQESFFDIFDPNGKLPKEIQQPGKAAIALRLYGPLTAPKTDYEYTVKKLASSAAKSAAKDALGKFLQKQGSGQGDSKGDPLKDAADKLKKKFFKF